MDPKTNGFPISEVEEDAVASDITIDRRTLLTYAAGSGAVLAAGLCGSAFEVAAAAQQAAPTQAARIRRIVTGHNAEGKSYIVNDETVPVSSVWATKPDQPLGAPTADEKVLVSRMTGETRFFMASIQPSRDPKPNLENRIGFHRTGGIAYCYLLGDIVFLVDTQEVRVRAGDVVIERNTMHSWRNDGTAPVAMVITSINAMA
jgi:hypothetical protein